jgi:energy-coupling factor transporter ATP-binding protein EcfA2
VPPVTQPTATVSPYPTILLFGSTGSGKTTLIGELAESLVRKGKGRTRYYTADRGGWETIRPYTELELSPGKPIIEVEPLTGNPWMWVDHAVRGEKRNAQGQWVPGTDPDIALYAFEGLTSIADTLMSWMADASSKGVNIGGGGSFSFTVKEGNEALKVGSNNQAHYSVAQQQAFEKSTQSQSLPGIVLWTAGDRRGDDDATGGVIGPQVTGKALIGEVSRWFKYTFRAAIEVMPGMPAKHILYTDRHIEMASKGLAQGMANARIPLDGKGAVNIPDRVEPASLVGILDLIDQRQVAAKDAIRKRLGL